ncbi:MAG: reductase, partial [Moraxellaceae bacterium]
INAVTSDKVDPISQQPELKVCAVALKLVEVFAADTTTHHKDLAGDGAGQAHRHESAIRASKVSAFAPVSEEISMTLIDNFATTLGLKTVVTPELSVDERSYLAGFIGGLQASAAHINAVPTLPLDCPVSPANRIYINGLLAGLFSRTLPIGVSAVNVSEGENQTPNKPVINILWASQTGNAEALAEKFAERLRESWTINSQAMNDYSVEKLAQDKHIIFITSTFGDGDAPDSGGDFWAQLTSASAPNLAHMEFALLALGDSNYDQFCGHGKKLFAHLQALGAKPIVDRVDCDTDFEVSAENWFAQLAVKLNESLNANFPTDASPIGLPINPPILPLTSTLASISDKKVDNGFTKNTPYLSRLVINKRLNNGSNAKDTRQFGFDLGAMGNQAGGIQYEAGDAMGIWPQNCPDLVNELAVALNVNREAPVIV